ncbi:general substrate transporter [Ascoidea rubescens DSM 1968]|uniref:General substrate transporter n=1 Tax=Ascoidea rubescens DSM 1968 TaxID=1344418 RepID=A0A1D2VMV2_9ASCO|nr:general substrate transporter [Ascoidea rubescens DSM 1968]ODV62942.1 general substrate transporter [Ascoidea rubescens DSM 1968]
MVEFKSPWTRQLILTTFVACLGSIQYGYHMAELNAPEAVMSCRKSIPGGGTDYDQTWFGRHHYNQCIPMESKDIGMATSIFSIGGLIGSVFASSLSDKLGRKGSSFINSSFFILGSLVLTFANSLSVLILGRLIAGIGAGTSIVVTPLLINEISPVNLRGFLGSMNQVSINIGILLTQLLALSWANDFQWRLLLLIGFFLGLINFISFFFVYESPKWLVKNNNLDHAKFVLHKIRGGNKSDSDFEIEEWLAHKNTSNTSNANNTNNTGTSNTPVNQSENANESDNLLVGDSVSTANSNFVSFSDYITSSHYIKSKIVVTGIMTGQQFCGINSIIFYGVSVIATILPQYAVTVNCVISILNVIVTFLSGTLVDRLGRKPLLVSSGSIMGVSCLLIGFAIIYSKSILVVIATFSYIIAFATGVGPIPFLLISEVTQLKATSIAQSYGTIMNWLATFMVGYLFPIINDKIGGYVYYLFAVICACFVCFVYYYIPETKGKKSYFDVWGTHDDDVHERRLE